MKFNYKKKYGQNFLQDTTICDKIVSAISPTPDDLIIEIGGGSGAITKLLKKYNSHLITYEIDLDTKKYLLPLEDEKTHIIYEDFLQSDINKVINNIKHDNLYIIGNLPYYITTPIIEKIIDTKIDPKSIVVMVQKEVADRFLAHPKTKDYGYMTVILNYNYDLKRLIEVPKEKFYPVPKVDSTVVVLTKKEKQNINYDKLKNILKEAFQFKRKTIQNNIKSIPKEKLSSVLTKHNYPLTSRAEEIDLETFIELSKL